MTNGTLCPPVFYIRFPEVEVTAARRWPADSHGEVTQRRTPPSVYNPSLPVGTVKASNGLRELSKASESAFTRLGYNFGKGGREGIVEYEVASPHPFSVRMEDLSTSYGNDRLLGMFSKPQGGTSVQIIVPDDDAEGLRAASHFVQEMVGGLKSKPWKGLGFVSSGTAKILWERWLNSDLKSLRRGP